MSWRRLLHIAGALVITVLAAMLLFKIDFRRTYEAVASVIWGWVLFGLSLNLLSISIQSFRWHLILSIVKRNVAFRNTLAAYLVGLTGNLVVPLKLGDCARAYALARSEGIAMTTALSSTVLDRIVDVSAFCALVVPAGLIYRAPLTFNISRAAVVGAIVFVTLVTAFVVALKGRPPGGKTFARLRAIIRRFMRMISALRRTGLFMRVGSVSAIVWIMRLVMIQAIFRAFAIELPVAAGLAVLIFVSCGVAVVSTPAGIGAYELTAVSALLLFGVDPTLALSYAITLHAIEVVPVALVGLLTLWVTGVRLGDVPERIAFTEALEIVDVEPFSIVQSAPPGKIEKR